MSSMLKNNAYHILGLDTSVSEKEILKRSKEIINRLKAEDIPEYDLDLQLFKNFRSEDKIKDALQRLQAPKKRIKEYFFWLQIADNVDEQVLGLLKEKDYLNAIRIWDTKSQGQTIKALFYKKNLAILYCLLLSVGRNKEFLDSSLAVWKDIVDSDKFWSSFSKVYKLHDEQTASQDIITDFKKHVVEYLADMYTELYHLHEDDDFLNKFQVIFSAKGEKINTSILTPAYKIINEAVEGLEKMEVSKDDVFDKEESEKIKHFVSIIQQELNKLMDIGLYDDSQTKIMRDRSAEALRTIVLDLHNNLNEKNKSEGLLAAAIKLAGTESLKNKLQIDLEQIRKNIESQENNFINIEIPGTFRNSNILFKDDYIQYNDDRRIPFNEVESISFDSSATTQNIYGVPVSTSYKYRVSVMSGKENISISLSASKDKSTQKEAWLKIVGAVSGLIGPIVVKKMIDKIFDRGEVVKIGSIDFSKLGYSKMKYRMFGKNEELMVYWTDTIYIPKLEQGMVVLWEEKDGKSKVFDSMPMSNANAVLIPDLVQACYDNRDK